MLTCARGALLLMGPLVAVAGFSTLAMRTHRSSMALSEQRATLLLLRADVLALDADLVGSFVLATSLPPGTVPTASAQLERLPRDIERLGHHLAHDPGAETRLQGLDDAARRYVTAMARADQVDGDETAMRLAVLRDRLRAIEFDAQVAAPQLADDVVGLVARVHRLLVGILVLAASLLVGLGIAAWRWGVREPTVVVCAWSGAIAYQGDWLPTEVYLQRRFGLRVSHGISDAEAERIRAQLPRPDIPPVDRASPAD